MEEVPSGAAGDAEYVTPECFTSCADDESRLLPHCPWIFRTCCSPTFVLADGSSNWSDGVVDAVETAAKMTEHFATGRFARGCEIVDADLRADKRDHIAAARGRRV